MDKSKSKNYLIVVITIFTFLTLIFTATYAFFAASQSINNVTNLSASLPTMTTFTTNATYCGIDVSPDFMTPENKNMSITDNCEIEVTINGSRTATCLYDVVVYDVSDNTYVRSNGVGTSPNSFEFSGTISGAATVNETQIDDLVGTTILQDETIVVLADDTPVVKTYNLEEKWYNLDLNQDRHIGESYLIRFSVENVRC